MPYIKKEHRTEATQRFPSTAGELNYAFTCLVHGYLDINGLDYQNVNDCIGALEGCKLEFYRRVVAPYEDYKKEENGDVFNTQKK